MKTVTVASDEGLGNVLRSTLIDETFIKRNKSASVTLIRVAPDVATHRTDILGGLAGNRQAEAHAMAELTRRCHIGRKPTRRVCALGGELDHEAMVRPGPPLALLIQDAMVINRR